MWKEGRRQKAEGRRVYDNYDLILYTNDATGHDIITNLSALKMSAESRFYPQWLAWLGLLPCLFLAFCIEPKIWLIGLLFVVAGIIWHFAAHLIPTNNKVESNKA